MSHPDPQAKLKQRIAGLADLSAEERVASLLELPEVTEGQELTGLGVESFLEDSEPMVRIAAANALWMGGEGEASPEDLVPVLAAELRSPGDLPLMSGTALVQMGEAAVPALVQAFEADDSNQILVRILGEIGGPEAESLLYKAVGSSFEEVAEEARDALEALAEEEEE